MVKLRYIFACSYITFFFRWNLEPSWRAAFSSSASGTATTPSHGTFNELKFLCTLRYLLYWFSTVQLPSLCECDAGGSVAPWPSNVYNLCAPCCWGMVGDGNRDTINLNKLQRLLYSKFGNWSWKWECCEKFRSFSDPTTVEQNLNCTHTEGGELS